MTAHKSTVNDEQLKSLIINYTAMLSVCIHFIQNAFSREKQKDTLSATTYTVKCD